MTSDEMEECVGIIERASIAILSTVPSKKGTAAANVRHFAGLLSAKAEAYLSSATIVPAVKAALDAARECGATVQTMARVRLQALTEEPLLLPGRVIANMLVRMSLAQEARIVVNSSFRSIDDAQVMSDFMTSSFNQASEVAADDMDSATYRAIITLQGDIAFFFAAKARELPRVVGYTTSVSRTSLAISQLLYQNGTRANDLRDENKVVHPAFMPRSGKALAV